MTDTQAQRKLQGRFHWLDGKSIHIEARFDRVALRENRLMFISLVAVSQDVKAIRAALAAGLDCPMHLKNITVTKHDESLEPADVWPSLSGYTMDSHRLGYGSIRAIFTCRQHGFRYTDHDEMLWQELKQDRFSTPMLRGWLRYMRKEIELRSLLSRCFTLECTCSLVSATTADLDSIVEHGIKNGLISIQDEAA
jgi:hypothetical protein